MLTDMKMTASEKKSMEPSVAEYRPPDYPYGLRISLDGEALKKLGIDMLDVGQQVTVHGVGVVVACSMNAGMHGEQKSVDIQLQQIGIEAEEKKQTTPNVKAERKIGRMSTVLSDD